MAENASSTGSAGAAQPGANVSTDKAAQLSHEALSFGKDAIKGLMALYDNAVKAIPPQDSAKIDQALAGRKAYEARITEAVATMQKVFDADPAQIEQAFHKFNEAVAEALKTDLQGKSKQDSQAAPPTTTASNENTGTGSDENPAHMMSGLTNALRHPERLMAMHLAMANLPGVGKLVGGIPLLGPLIKLLGTVATADVSISAITGEKGMVSNTLANGIDKAITSSAAGKVMTGAAKVAAPVVAQAVGATKAAANNARVQTAAGKLKIPAAILANAMAAVERVHANIEGLAEAKGPVRPISRDEAGIDEGARAKI